MKRKTIIVYMTTIPELYSNLKLFCEIKGISYNTYSKRKLPFEFEGIEVHRAPLISGSIKDYL